jgi:hypothetical protein
VIDAAGKDGRGAAAGPGAGSRRRGGPAVWFRGKALCCYPMPGKRRMIRVPTVLLDAAPDETAEQAFNALRDLLRVAGVERHIRHVNPITHGWDRWRYMRSPDEWLLVISVVGSLDSLKDGLNKAIEVWQKMRADRNVQFSDERVPIDLKTADIELRIRVRPGSKPRYAR